MGARDFNFVYLRISNVGRIYCFSSELPNIEEEFSEFKSFKRIEEPLNLDEIYKRIEL